MHFKKLFAVLLYGVSSDSFSILSLPMRAARYSSRRASMNSDDDLQQALALTQERAMEDFKARAPSWLQDRSSLPFNCTACGKCCKTTGSVYLSPSDVRRASDVLNMTQNAFLKEYAAKFGNAPTGRWAQLKEKQDAQGLPACIFLDLDTNHCQIYEARPVQCRTYPFWPVVLQSIESWNDECRSRDDQDDSGLSKWTTIDGGCEGMALLNDTEFEGGVLMDEVYRQLLESVQDSRSFPRR